MAFNKYLPTNKSRIQSYTAISLQWSQLVLLPKRRQTTRLKGAHVLTALLRRPNVHDVPVTATAKDAVALENIASISICPRQGASNG